MVKSLYQRQRAARNQHAYYLRNKTKVIAKNVKWAKDNKKRKNAYNKKWYYSHKPWIQLWRRRHYLKTHS